MNRRRFLASLGAAVAGCAALPLVGRLFRKPEPEGVAIVVPPAMVAAARQVYAQGWQRAIDESSKRWGMQFGGDPVAAHAEACGEPLTSSHLS